MKDRIQSFFRKPAASYFIVLFLLLLDRFLLLSDFHFIYTGNDDLIYWLGAKDYSQGIFHEPYFYGQNYSFMLEALFAVPLIWLKVPYQYALPLVSACLSLFPFVFSSAVLYRRKFFSEALVFLLIPLLLPVEYGMLSSMSRGFISGLFFSGFLVLPVLEPRKTRSWLIFALSFSLGYIFNPNSLVVSFPVGIYLLLTNYARIRFYLLSLAVALPVLAVEFFSKRFYETNPAYNTHPLVHFNFNFQTILADFHSLDKFFTYFMPAFWNAGWLILPLLSIAGILLLRKEKAKGISLLLAVAFIIFTLGIEKVNDHIDAIYLTSARMYLGIPLVTTLAFFWCRSLIRVPDERLAPALLFSALVVFCIRSSVMNLVIRTHTLKTNYAAVAVKKMKDVKCDCEKLGQLARQYKPEVISTVANHWMNTADFTFYTYACPLLEKDLPPVVLGSYEKRTWLAASEMPKVTKRVLIIGSLLSEDQADSLKFKIVSTNPRMVLFEENEKRLDSLLNWAHRTGRP